MGTRYVNGVDTMIYTEEEIKQFAKMPKEQSWVDLHDNEFFGDGKVKDGYEQCKDCEFRDRTTVQGVECGWFKCFCELYEAPEYKPIGLNNDCEFYEKE